MDKQKIEVKRFDVISKVDFKSMARVAMNIQGHMMNEFHKEFNDKYSSFERGIIVEEILQRLVEINDYNIKGQL